MKKFFFIFSLVLLALVSLLTNCISNDDDNNDTSVAVLPFKFSSLVIDSMQPIPKKYSCDGENISPPLSWANPPNGTKSFVLILDDPDAPGGTWDHWVVFNISASETGFKEGASPNGSMPANAIEGQNSWIKSEYGGPCPPGGTHHYFFKLYAIDTVLSLTSSASKLNVLSAINGHIIEQLELVGTYTR